MYRGVQTTTLLGGEGERGKKLRQIVLIVPRILSSIVAPRAFLLPFVREITF